MNGILYRETTFTDLMKKILSFFILFKKKYSKELVATYNVDTLKGKMASEFLTGMIIQYYYRYTRVAKMMLRNQSVLWIVNNLNSDDAGSKLLGSSKFNQVELYTCHGGSLISNQHGSQVREKPKWASSIPRPYILLQRQEVFGEADGSAPIIRYRDCFKICWILKRKHVSFMQYKQSAVVDLFKLHASPQQCSKNQERSLWGFRWSLEMPDYHRHADGFLRV